MQKLEVKSYWSPDIQNPWGYKSWENNVIFSLEMEIGLTGEKTQAIYSVIVATPQGISNLPRNHFLLHQCSKLLLLEKYSWDSVVAIIEKKLAAITICSLSSWEDIHYRLCRLFYLERTMTTTTKDSENNPIPKYKF